MSEGSLEIWPTGLTGAKQGSLVALLSSISFWIISLIAIRCTPKVAEKQKWRFKNITVSLVHATLSGSWAVICFIEEPNMSEDLIQTHTTLGHVLVSVSVGYFLYDTFDMLIYQRTRQTLELLLHHFVKSLQGLSFLQSLDWTVWTLVLRIPFKGIIACFGLAMFTKLYVGYAVLALIVELNSIFLHLRQLMQCCGIGKTNSFYRLNSLINLGTFLVFRILTLAWMTRWLVINRDLLPLAFYSMGSIGLATMTVMNIILFHRLLNSDFLRKNDSIKKEG